jgi:hypothetical protein
MDTEVWKLAIGAVAALGLSLQVALAAIKIVAERRAPSTPQVPEAPRCAGCAWSQNAADDATQAMRPEGGQASARLCRMASDEEMCRVARLAARETVRLLRDEDSRPTTGPGLRRPHS